MDDYTKKAIERFYKCIEIADNGCHEWKGTKNVTGHGRFYYKGKQMMAHRFVMEIIKGVEVGDWRVKVVRHSCDNAACVNPDHLDVGFQFENRNDYYERGIKKTGKTYR